VRVAIPYWRQRVSPVFDVAKHLLLVDIEDSAEVARSKTTINETDLLSRVSHFVDLGVELVICGAISRSMKLILEARGIDVIGQVCGNTEEVLEAFLQGHLNDRSFLMPGCRISREDFELVSQRNQKNPRNRKPNMRIAISSQGPDLTSQVDPRFGRARYFIVIETKTEELTVLDNIRNLNAAQGAGIQTVKDVINKEVDAVLTGQVGPKALEALETARVQVFLGASGTVKQAVQKLRSGQLKSVPRSALK
jgi:predicted Fe-Mo cluster-binding NifX family protein